jgi:hypothetical protein
MLASMASKDRMVWIWDEFSLGYIESDLQLQHLRNELKIANGDVLKLKIALAVGLADNIAAQMQQQYGYITSHYLKIREELSR